MPIQSGKYVAPTWVNNAPPALDADELNAMSDTIESSQPIIGDIKSTVDTNPGYGWILCNGEEVDSSSKLYNVLNFNTLEQDTLFKEKIINEKCIGAIKFNGNIYFYTVRSNNKIVQYNENGIGKVLITSSYTISSADVCILNNQVCISFVQTISSGNNYKPAFLIGTPDSNFTANYSETQGGSSVSIHGIVYVQNHYLYIVRIYDSSWGTTSYWIYSEERIGVGNNKTAISETSDARIFSYNNIPYFARISSNNNKERFYLYKITNVSNIIYSGEYVSTDSQIITILNEMYVSGNYMYLAANQSNKSSIVRFNLNNLSTNGSITNNNNANALISINNELYVVYATRENSNILLNNIYKIDTDNFTVSSVNNKNIPSGISNISAVEPNSSGNVLFLYAKNGSSSVSFVYFDYGKKYLPLISSDLLYYYIKSE